MLPALGSREDRARLGQEALPRDGEGDNEFDPLAERAIAAYADDDMHPGGQRVGTIPTSEAV